MTLRTSSDGDDAIDAGHLLGGAGVDRLDAAMGDRAAEDLAVQHAGKPHGVGVFGAPGDLLARLEPRRRTSDLTADARGDVAALHGGGCHQRLAPLLLRAFRQALVKGLAHGAADIDAKQLAFVGGRAAHVRDALGLRRPRHRRRARGSLSSTVAPASTFSALLRRMAFSVAALTTTRADLTAGPSAIERDRHAERRPILGRAGGDLHIGRARFALCAGCAARRSVRSSPARSRNSRRTDPRPRSCARLSGPTIATSAPSAISTGGRSMCGSPCARLPPMVATLRTRMLESRRMARGITGAARATSASARPPPAASSRRW